MFSYSKEGLSWFIYSWTRQQLTIRAQQSIIIFEESSRTSSAGVTSTILSSSSRSYTMPPSCADHAIYWRIILSLWRSFFRNLSSFFTSITIAPISSCLIWGLDHWVTWTAKHLISIWTIALPLWPWGLSLPLPLSAFRKRGISIDPDTFLKVPWRSSCLRPHQKVPMLMAFVLSPSCSTFIVRSIFVFMRRVQHSADPEVQST